MNIKSNVTNIQSLDDDLDLFNENDWNFLDVSDNFSNVEYFNDIRDTQFDKGAGKEDLKHFMMISTYIAVLVICIMILVDRTGVLDKTDYDKVSQIQSVTDKSNTSLQRVEGNPISDEDLIEISNTINNYFTVLNTAKSYDELYNYCAMTSVFADTYKSRVSSIQTTYDVNDCYARMLRNFGSYCKSGRINEVVEKDGVYYVYINLSLPTDSDTSDFVYAYAYNFTKHFNSTNATEENILQYLLEIMKENKYNCSTYEYCLKMKKNDYGNIVLVDDSMISSACIEAYSDIIRQTQQTVGGNIQNIQQ